MCPAPTASVTSGACLAAPLHSWWSAEARALPVADALAEKGHLAGAGRHRLPCAAAHAGQRSCPDLIIGHGVLGRLLARLVISLGGDAAGGLGEQRRTARQWRRATPLRDPADDTSQYRSGADASGDRGIVDRTDAAPGTRRRNRPGRAFTASRSLCLSRLPSCAKRECASPPNGNPKILLPCATWPQSGALSAGRADYPSLAGQPGAAEAYRTAFGDPDCLKMILDWRGVTEC